MPVGELRGPLVLVQGLVEPARAFQDAAERGMGVNVARVQLDGGRACSPVGVPAGESAFRSLFWAIPSSRWASE